VSSCTEISTGCQQLIKPLRQNALCSANNEASAPLTPALLTALVLSAKHIIRTIDAFLLSRQNDAITFPVRAFFTSFTTAVMQARPTGQSEQKSVTTYRCCQHCPCHWFHQRHLVQFQHWNLHHRSHHCCHCCQSHWCHPHHRQCWSLLGQSCHCCQSRWCRQHYLLQRGTEISLLLEGVIATVAELQLRRQQKQYLQLESRYRLYIGAGQEG